MNRGRNFSGIFLPQPDKFACIIQGLWTPLKVNPPAIFELCKWVEEPKAALKFPSLVTVFNAYLSCWVGSFARMKVSLRTVENSFFIIEFLGRRICFECQLMLDYQCEIWQSISHLCTDTGCVRKTQTFQKKTMVTTLFVLHLATDFRIVAKIRMMPI